MPRKCRGRGGQQYRSGITYKWHVRPLRRKLNVHNGKDKEVADESERLPPYCRSWRLSFSKAEPRATNAKIEKRSSIAMSKMSLPY